jgi:beta-barrel assembly-enhancing protease
MKVLLLGLAALAVVGAAATVRQPKANGVTVAEYQLLAERDLRLATIGYHLAKASAPYCKVTSRNPGWVLHDIAQYGDALAARAAFDFREPVSVSIVVEGGGAALAGIKPGDGLVSLNGRKWVWTSGTKGRPAWERVEATRTEILGLLDSNGSATLLLAQQDGTKTITLAPDPICASDFRVDPRPKRDAGADGETVRVTSGLIDYVTDDDELAAVVAHELSHNLLGHRARIDATQKGKTRLTKITEEEADRLSVWLMANAGYDPEAAISFWQRYGKATGLGIFTAPTHHRWESRVAMMREEIDRINATGAANGRRDPPLLAAYRGAQ